MSDVAATVMGVLFGAWANSFLAEDFRRHRNRAAIAGALSGELKSHMQALDLMDQSWFIAIQMVKQGAPFKLRSPPEQVDRVYEAYVDQIGLLGSELAHLVAYAYGQVAAFRASMHVLSAQFEDMEVEEKLRRMEAVQQFINFRTVGMGLADVLHSVSKKGYLVSIFGTSALLGANEHLDDPASHTTR